MNMLWIDLCVFLCVRYVCDKIDIILDKHWSNIYRSWIIYERNCENFVFANGWEHGWMKVLCRWYVGGVRACDRPPVIISHWNITQWRQYNARAGRTQKWIQYSTLWAAGAAAVSRGHLERVRRPGEQSRVSANWQRQARSPTCRLSVSGHESWAVRGTSNAGAAATSCRPRIQFHPCPRDVCTRTTVCSWRARGPSPTFQLSLFPVFRLAHFPVLQTRARSSTGGASV